VKAKGNLNDGEDITTLGQMAINDFHFGKNSKEDYASFDKLVFAMNEISPKGHKYFFDSVSLTRPYLKYERYDYLDNVQTMFGEKGVKYTTVKSDPEKYNLIIEIANYVKVLSKNFFKSDYKVNRLAIYNGDLKFNDYSINEKFSIDLNPLCVISDSIDKNHKRVKASFKSGIKPFGEVSIILSINPKDSSDFDMQYRVQKLPAALFNPYTISYTSYPLDKGTIECKGTWNVRNGIIQSNNHLLIIDPRVSKRLRNKDLKWIPVPLVMSFVRERGNVIDYEIPITGNLKNPKFHLSDMLFDLLRNIFVKPATTPYRMKVKNTETEIEKSLTLKWQIRQNSLRPNQEIFIKRIADFLVKNSNASIDVQPQQYVLKEKEHILFFEAKKKYFLSIKNENTQSFSAADSEKVDKMSVKDSLFVHFLSKQVNDHMLFTIQDKCASIINAAKINAKFEQLKRERQNAFIYYFKERGVEKQIKISESENIIPYNGFSFYKIEYKGQFPESLIKAYRDMNELNDKEPRKKFKEERRKNANAL
jgi:hypothetical protein